jgi:hypothetical protein
MKAIFKFNLPEGTSEDALNAYYECKDKLIELLNENNIEL